jgi:hypothetical protein
LVRSAQWLTTNSRKLLGIIDLLELAIPEIRKIARNPNRKVGIRKPTLAPSAQPHGGGSGRIATVTEQDSIDQIEKIRREIVGGALPKELATGAEGLFLPGETRDRIWLKILQSTSCPLHERSWKAAAFARWHEPDDAGVSSPDLRGARGEIPRAYSAFTSILACPR